MRRLIVISAIALLVVALFGPAASAAVRHGTRAGAVVPATEVDRHGSCSLSSKWELDLETVATGIKVDFEVDTTQAGKTWHVTLKHNGTAFFTGNRVTDNEGDFDVEKKTDNAGGTDYFRARATQAASGEVCIGKAHI